MALEDGLLNDSAQAKEAVFTTAMQKIAAFIPFEPSQKLINDIRTVSDAAVDGATAQVLRIQAGGPEQVPGTDEEREATNEMFRTVKVEFDAAQATYPVKQSYQSPMSVLYNDIKTAITDVINDQYGVDFKLGLIQITRPGPMPRGPGR